MITVIYYIAFLKSYTHSTMQSTKTRAINIVSVFEIIHKSYTQSSTNVDIMDTIKKHTNATLKEKE